MQPNVRKYRMAYRRIRLRGTKLINVSRSIESAVGFMIANCSIGRICTKFKFFAQSTAKCADGGSGSDRDRPRPPQERQRARRFKSMTYRETRRITAAKGPTCKPVVTVTQALIPNLSEKRDVAGSSRHADFVRDEVHQ